MACCQRRAEKAELPGKNTSSGSWKQSFQDAASSAKQGGMKETRSSTRRTNLFFLVFSFFPYSPGFFVFFFRGRWGVAIARSVFVGSLGLQVQEKPLEDDEIEGRPRPGRREGGRVGNGYAHSHVRPVAESNVKLG